MPSLQAKLSSGLLLSLVVSFSAFWLLVSINIQYLAEEYIASRLQHDTETLLSAISFDNKGDLSIDTQRIGLVYNQPFSGHYFIISKGTQQVSSRSLWDQGLDYTSVNTGAQSRTLQAGPENQSLLVIANGYNKQGQQLTITIAEDLNPLKRNINQFKYGFTALALGMLLILVILQILILRSSLKPLIKIQTELKSLEKGQLKQLNTDSPKELRPLINEVNHLLSIMEQRLRRSRNSLSDLAHAIKKPLTVIKQVLDKNTLPETEQASLHKQADDIYQLTDRILKRARLAGPSHSGALFSFTEDLPALIKTLEMIYAEKSLQLSTQIPHHASCPLDREDMLELLGNLLDNAYKWATKNVNLRIASDTHLHICIEDDGPGADAKKIDKLAKRGVRLDEKTQGHGFGLAISADIISDYNGSLEFSRSTALEGFRIDISIPLT